MDAIRQQVLDAAKDRFLQGDSFRLRHRYKQDGVVCTPESSDPAMTVTKVSTGWLYHCHRCHTSGCIYDSNMGPALTIKKLDALKKIKIHKDVEKISLPYDFQPMDQVDHAENIPYPAFHWLWQYGLNEKHFKEYGIGWSEAYNRVIIPINEYAVLGENTVATHLKGWIGRDVQTLTKAQRKEKRIPKYLTRAEKGKRRYFVCHGDPKVWTICEDCVSAIKVNDATGHSTIALLNSAVGDDLMRMLRGSLIYLWLDGDMLANSVKTVSRMRQLGLDAKHIHTPKDPKCYNTLFIQETLRRD